MTQAEGHVGLSDWELKVLAPLKGSADTQRRPIDSIRELTQHFQIFSYFFKSRNSNFSVNSLHFKSKQFIQLCKNTTSNTTVYEWGAAMAESFAPINGHFKS